MSADPASARARRVNDPLLPVRARDILRVRAVWSSALLLGSAVVALMTALYIGSVVDPVSHLHGLPVAVVDEDRGASLAGRHLDVGDQLVAGLQASPAVTGRLRLDVTDLQQARRAMGRGALYVTAIVPPGFTTDLLTAAGLVPAESSTVAAPRVTLLTNPQAGTIGVGLATGVLQPALAVASHQVGRQLSVAVPPGSETAATRLFLSDPITVTSTNYRPLSSHSALGLSAFYIALLTILGGFFAGTVVNSVVDSALGYAPTEVGPHWHHRPPVPISRWQTLLVKWPIAVVLSAVIMGVMELVAVPGLGMDAPYPMLLWAYSWLCAASVAVGTVVLFAVAGTSGQLIGLVIFVYAGLASAGGTVPVQALPGFLRALSTIEPLRQILGGTRSILYFGAQADAGLARGALLAGIGLVFWVVLGAMVVKWYDRRGFYRVNPDVLVYVRDAVDGYMKRQAPPASATMSGE